MRQGPAFSWLDSRRAQPGPPRLELCRAQGGPTPPRLDLHPARPGLAAPRPDLPPRRGPAFFSLDLRPLRGAGDPAIEGGERQLPGWLYALRGRGRHLPGWVSAPVFVRWDLLAFHEEGVRGDNGAVADRHPIVNEGTHSERAAGTDRGDVGLEGSILLRVGLDPAPRVEGAVVADDDKRPLRHPEAVIEDPAADPDTEQTPEQGLERGSVEDLDNPRPCRHLPESFVAPKRRS